MYQQGKIEISQNIIPTFIELHTIKLEGVKQYYYLVYHDITLSSLYTHNV